MKPLNVDDETPLQLCQSDQSRAREHERARACDRGSTSQLRAKK